MDHRGEPAVALGPQRHPLPCLRAEADRGEELAPGQLEAHRAPGAAGGHRGKGDVRPGPQRRAEGAADEGIDDAHLVGRDAEAAGDLVAFVADPLGLAPQREVFALPVRDGGVRLHRVVLLARLRVDRIDPDGCGGEGGVGVALAGLRTASLLGGSLGGRLGEAGVEVQLAAGIGRVGHADQRRRIQSLRLRRRHHQRDRLTTEPDLGILQHPQLLARHRVHRRPLGRRLIGQPLGVEMGQHQQHARRALGGRGVDRGDAAGGDRAVVRRRVGEAVGMELGGVTGAARHLGGPVHAGEGRADRGHASAPVSISARATVRRISSSL